MPIKIDPKEMKELEKSCICQRCPTYDDCCRKDKKLLFCFNGKSGCKLVKYGCVCPSCPVQKKKGFAGMYFCINGEARP